MNLNPSPPGLDAFRAGAIDPARFTHREHVRMAFDLLAVASFPQALLDYSVALGKLTDKAGAADKFNQTITVAFLSLIAEAMARSPAARFDDFINANEQLLRSDGLLRFYTPPRLHGALARRTFLLPDRLALT